MTALTDALARHVESGEVPGLVAVVGRHDAVDVTVLGDQAVGGTPMREDSLFRIASIGKPITAAAVLTLVADERVALDDPIGDWLPELAEPRVLREPTGPIDDTVAAARPITVRDLLRSTNGHGFPSDFSAPVVALLFERLRQGPPQPQLVPPPDEWMAILSGIPLLHQPAEGFTYNTAFDILGVLVARATGQPFAGYVADRILRPLGMTETGLVFPTGTADRATTYYRRGDDGDRDGDLAMVDAPDGQWSSEPAFASGAGGFVSTVADVLAFQRMLLANGGDVLPPELVAAMMTDQLNAAIRATDTAFLDGQSWGYGGGVDIAVRNPWNVLGRYGWVGGTGTSAYIVPADGSVAILLTQVELAGPNGSAVLESFWAAAASHLGHDR
ncbi:MAG: serine hydrolase domain-containing protein [Ilumatobacteraceae bacterium]